MRWIALPPPARRKELRWVNTGAVRTLAQQLRPEVIIERYYNFGGEGIRAAADIGALAVLEVNAPVVDYPGSPKRMLDRALLFESRYALTPGNAFETGGGLPLQLLELAMSV